MSSILRFAGQAIILVLLAAGVAYLSSAPAYQHFPADEALIKLTFIHGGKPAGECHERSDEELEKLAPNMRRRLVCPRERLPVTVELDVDGTTVHSETISPSGLHDDGPSVFYRAFPVTAGGHDITVRLRDSARETGYDYEGAKTVALEPAQLLVIQFRPELGGFVFR